MLASLRSATLLGIDGRPVTSRSTSRRAARLLRRRPARRRRAASRASGSAPRCCRRSSPWPLQRITVNLAPGGLRKTGAGFELAVALGLLVAAEDAARRRRSTASACSASWASTARCAASRAPSRSSTRCAAPGCRRVIVPLANAAEAALVDGVEVLAGAHPRRVARLPQGRGRVARPSRPPPRAARRRPRPDEPLDLADVRGLADRAARARRRRGGRAPPAARRTARHGQDDARPPPPHRSSRRSTRDAALEVTRIHSVAGPRPPTRCHGPPFRAPHHTASTAALVGGGSGRPTPGRGHPRAPRHPVPRRARRVRALGARRAPPAARGRRGARQPPGLDSSSPPASCWSRAATRARAAWRRACRCTAPSGRATAGACPRHSSTGSTSGSRVEPGDPGEPTGESAAATRRTWPWRSRGRGPRLRGTPWACNARVPPAPRTVRAAHHRRRRAWIALSRASSPAGLGPHPTGRAHARRSRRPARHRRDRPRDRRPPPADLDLR